VTSSIQAQQPRPLSACRRPSLAELGVHPLALVLLATNVAIVAVTLPFYGAFGLDIDWTSFVPATVAIAFAAVGWLAHWSTPGRTHEWPVAETFVVFALIALCFTVATPAQYLAVALKRPLADPWLAEADAFLGISVPDVVAWTRSQPGLTSILRASYYSLMPQFVAPLVILGLFYRDREPIWEFAFHFHFCLLITLIGLALFPAMCAFSYYGFESLLEQSRFIRHFDALRDGTFRTLQLRELEGMITFPSFHVAGGLMVTWVFRRYRRMFAALCLLNTLLIASTILLGPHYAVDVIASLVVFGASLTLYACWGRGLHPRGAQAGTVPAGRRRSREPMPARS
jgi:hypothetical protein